MPANFLHGVETIEVDKGARPITTVKSAIIGIVGTAPVYEVDSANKTINQLQLITNDVDAAKYFGSGQAGYTIPQALDAIFDQGSGIVIAVNVFDPAVHKTSVTDEAQTFGADNKVKLAHAGISNVVVKNTTGTPVYALNTDYTIDAITGTITRTTSGGTIPANQAVKVSYDYADVSKVTVSDIIGAVDASGNRTGLKLLKDSYSKYGYSPKILISPVFCTQSSVKAEMEVTASALKAVALVDAPIGTTFDQAIAGRGTTGVINFNSSSDRSILCFPHLKVFDTILNVERLEPYSQRLAGIIAAKDNDKGYHWSPSNTEIKGITGIERQLTSSINDPNCEVNLLNAAGIMTVFNSFGTGFRTWGNRSAAYPASTAPVNFINVRRTADIIDGSVEYSMLQFIDYPIDNGLIDAVCESVNGFLRTLIGKGAIIDGKCKFNPSENSVTEMAAGHLVFNVDYLPPFPNERMTFKRFIDINMLKALLGGSN